MLYITVPVAYAGLGGWLIRRHGDTVGRLALALLGVALALHVGLLGPLLFEARSAGLSFGYTLSLIGLAVAIAAAAGAWRARSKSLAGLALIVSAALTAATGVGEVRPGGSLAWPLLAHIALSIIAYGLLTVAALTALALAFKDRALRSRRPTTAHLFVSVEALETQLFGAIGAGFAALSLAIFSGLFYVDDLLAQHLLHKTVLTIAAWLLFAMLLFGRWRFGWRGQTAARWTLGGFFLLLLAYFGSRFVLEVLLDRQWG